MDAAAHEALASALSRAENHSPFLAQLIDKYGDVVVALRSRAISDVLRMVVETEGATVAARLRRGRNRLMLAVALADLADVLPLEQVVEALSDFADTALDAAIAAAVEGHVPGATAQGFAAIALGKHGSRELNYSSDIDPVFIYDPAMLPHRPREDVAEAAVRIARRVIDLLQARDGDGFVFRVDLRLRPASEATPIALPVEAAIAHYESSALPWERAAFIRARAAAGDVALGQRFLDAIQPFVWRRSLDYGAVDELRGLTRQIRDHHAGQLLGPGFDVKRGRGGIREIEFYAQIHQLIHGGRNPALRLGATMPALAALQGAGWIPAEEARDLSEAYRLLRTIEHRLQLIDDRQTHILPIDTQALDGVARLHGLNDGPALLALLAPGIDRVGTLYDALDDRTAASPKGIRVTGAAIAASGFVDSAGAEARVARWRQGGVRAIRSPAAVAAFEDLLPALLTALGKAPDPDAALSRLDLLLDKLSSGVNLFRLLDAIPELRRLLVDILSHAPTLADALAARPALLDRLIDRTALGPVPDVDALGNEMRGDARDAESLFDRVRHIVGEYRFALGTQIVEGAADPLDVAAGYARVAEAAVETITSRVVGDFEAMHGAIGDGGFVILALGRLGGGLLTHASDLDLIYLFAGDHLGTSDGARPLGATVYFNRLAQRVSGALSVPTSAGALYDVDTRLRPSGSQGPLVVSLDAFDRYQREAAWTWEHMALLRARPIYGSAADRAATQAVIDRALGAPRAHGKLVADVVSMRAEIARHKPPAGAFDVKQGAGGLVELEFAVHFHQLATQIGLVPDLRPAIDALVRADVLGTDLYKAHDLLTRLLVTLRLVSPQLGAPPKASRDLVARACGIENWTRLLVELDRARHCVVRHWTQVLKEESTS